MLVARKGVIPVTQWQDTFLTGDIIVAYPSDWQITHERDLSLLKLRRKLGESIVIYDVSDEPWDIGPRALRRAKIIFEDENPDEHIVFVEEGSLDLSWDNVYFTAACRLYDSDVERAELHILVGNGDRTVHINLVIFTSAQAFIDTVNIATQIAASVRFLNPE